MSVLLPLRQWRTADPAVLSGSRCIARTAQDVIIDGRLEPCRQRPHQHERKSEMRKKTEMPLGHRRMDHRNGELTMKTTGKAHITSHARKWHKTSPCPYCDAPKPIIERYARIIGATTRFFWIAKCRGCPNAIWITTPDDDIKTAIRGWNRYANGEWRKR